MIGALENRSATRTPAGVAGCQPASLSHFHLLLVHLSVVVSLPLQAIHYASSSSAGSYKDEVVASIIKKHNQYVHSAMSRKK